SWFFSLGKSELWGMDWNWGWITSVALILAGIAGLLFLPKTIHWTPITLQRFKRFRSIRRGWISLLIILFLAVIALLDQALVGRRALVVKHDGNWFFPAFVKQHYPQKTFFGSEESETDYRLLKRKMESGELKGFVLMPLVPWASVLDSDDLQTKQLQLRDGLYFVEGDDHPFSGRAARYYHGLQKTKHTDMRLRRGLPDGEWLGYAPNGGLAVRANYLKGEKTDEEFTGEMKPDEFTKANAGDFTVTVYPPIPPMWSARHYLGTDSRGWDVLAQIYGGWQLNLKAIFVYLLVTYGVGILIGTLMGYFGGWFDMIFQRIIEILEELPFLYIVMIVVGIVGVANMNLPLLLGVICVFSWTGLTYALRAQTYKEKERDYISAARLQGASTWRIVTRYIVPNLLATLVTLIPFSVVGIISSLTALAFIGFGLPETYPQWGTLFDDGLNHLSARWITLSMFTIMVVILLLVTFVGEALREAFDPKKFSTYQ
ncbi:MAG: ABC transporter permease subunit, partial [Verrucomicrobiales bacterium]|nr:ABC transporter permease subunit [Verrucomicrobiales bacterium]